jgi:hypothetical protein
MPRSARLLAALIAAPIAFAAAAAFAASSSMTLAIKHSERVALRGVVANVIVDDPGVADVAMVDNHSVIIIGKGYGATDILVLGKGGRTLLHSQVAVVAPESGPVTLYSGATPSEFSCVRRCQALSAPPPANNNGGGDNSGGDNSANAGDAGQAKATAVQPSPATP